MKKSIGRKDFPSNVLFQGQPGIKGPKIPGNPPQDPVSQKLLSRIPIRKKSSGFPIGKRLDFHLSGNPSVKRTLVSHDLIDHEADTGAAKDQKNILPFPGMVDHMLKNAFNGRILPSQKRKLIDDENGFFLGIDPSGNEIQGLFPTLKRSHRTAQQPGLDQTGKILEVQGIILFLGREKQTRVPVGKFLEYGGFPYPTAAIHHQKLESLRSIGFFQYRKFFFPSDHILPPLKIILVSIILTSIIL